MYQRWKRAEGPLGRSTMSAPSLKSRVPHWASTKGPALPSRAWRPVFHMLTPLGRSPPGAPGLDALHVGQVVPELEGLGPARRSG